MSDEDKTEASCGCGCIGQPAIQSIESLGAPKNKRSLLIQFMYIDLSQCTR